jgi:1,4-dihydroxy-2-naphthoate octaprenyltransferase
LKLKSWIKAFRLRTLPLALSSVLMGIVVAFINGATNYHIGIWAMITTLLLQILSNLANDYGDGIKGTDNEMRLGPGRALQTGAISPYQMKIGIGIFAFASLICGLYLLYISHLTSADFVVFVVLGVAAILSAILYTIGKKAYGYSGFGDLFVFLFFGLLAVGGTSYLIMGQFKPNILLPSITMGLLSTAVLNLNNIRDYDNDLKMGKKTIVVKLGINAAKLYHTIIVNLAFIFMLIFVGSSDLHWSIYLSFIIYVFFILDLKKIEREQYLKNLDKYLKSTAIKTFIFVFLFAALVFINSHLSAI